MSEQTELRRLERKLDKLERRLLEEQGTLRDSLSSCPIKAGCELCRERDRRLLFVSQLLVLLEDES